MIKIPHYEDNNDLRLKTLDDIGGILEISASDKAPIEFKVLFSIGGSVFNTIRAVDMFFKGDISYENVRFQFVEHENSKLAGPNHKKLWFTPELAEALYKEIELDDKLSEKLNLYYTPLNRYKAQ